MSIRDLDVEFTTLTKRCLKSILPSPETTEANLTQIIVSYNKITIAAQLIIQIDDSTPESEEVKKVFLKCRERLIKVLRRLGERIKVPEVPGIQVNRLILLGPDESYTEHFSDSEDSEDSEGEDMATPIQLGQFISSHLKDFDGNSADLNNFISRINDVKSITPEASILTSLAFIKNKITDQNLKERIGELTTFDALIADLRLNISKPDTKLILDKLRALKYTDRNPLQLVDEIKTVTKELSQAYQIHGMSIDLANGTVRDHLSDVLAVRSGSEMVRNAMVTSRFTSLDEIYTILLRQNISRNASVNAMHSRNFRGRNGGYDRRNSYRFRGGQHFKSGRGNRGNRRGSYFDSNRGNYQHYRGSNRGRGRGNNRGGRGGYQGHQQPRQTYTATSTPAIMGPQDNSFIQGQNF